MRIVNVKEISSAVSQCCIEINYELKKDIKSLLEKAASKDISSSERKTLELLIENSEVAEKDNLALCQDTGLAVIFIEVGQNVHFKGGTLNQAVQEGVKKGYTEGFLRKSVVDDPLFKRMNTQDNTPAVIHTKIVPGSKIKIQVSAKGGGSENMSRLKMLNPGDGVEGLINFTLNTVKKAGPNACPPLIVGIGIGGNFEQSAILAKKALLRPPETGHSNEKYKKLEERLLKDINKLGIGPQGLGGKTTALAVNIETFPCHIASLPAAVNLNCHSSRHKQVII